MKHVVKTPARELKQDVSPRTGAMKTVTSADGTPIAFEKTGNGPPLVLVPAGGANDHTRWEAAGVRPTFAEHFTVYAMDCRGRGASGDSPSYDLAREFEDVAAVVNSIDEPVNLLGHSLGALFALEASLLTDNLSTLILYEPPVPVSGYELISSDIFAEMKVLLDLGKKEQALLLFLHQVASPEEVKELRTAQNWENRVDAAHTIFRERLVFEYEFSPSRFANMTTPTLLLTGRHTHPFFRYATKAVHEALPKSRIVTFDGHGHVAMLTATDRFIDEVLTFVREFETER